MSAASVTPCPALLPRSSMRMPTASSPRSKGSNCISEAVDQPTPLARAIAPGAISCAYNLPILALGRGERISLTPPPPVVLGQTYVALGGSDPHHCLWVETGVKLVDFG